MDVMLNISSNTLDDDHLQSLTSDLCTTLSREADVTATLAEESVSGGTRGVEITLGTIIITFLSSGSAIALFNVLRSYFDRDSSLEMELEREDGRRLRINAQNVRPTQMDQALEQISMFLGDS
jgi:hypothetical protein